MATAKIVAPSPDNKPPPPHSDGDALARAATEARKRVGSHARLDARVSQVSQLTQLAQLDSTCVADVEREEVRWLWPNRIAFGKLGILEGMPGVGKSTLALEIAANLTNGFAMPDSGGEELAPASVLVLSAEDAIADTIRPRLEAANADLVRVHVAESEVTIADIARLRFKLVETSAGLLIIDPLEAYLPRGVDAHRNTDVRRVLMPLVKLAEERGVAVLVIRHLQKAPMGNAVVAGQGSIGIIGASRTALLAAQDRDDPTLVTLALVKSNIGRRPSALQYRLVPEPALGCARIEWLGTSESTADDLISAMHVEPSDHTALAETVDWLKQELIEGQRDAAEIFKRAEEAVPPIPRRRVQRAAQRLGVVSRRKSEARGGSTWELKAS